VTITATTHDAPPTLRLDATDRCDRCGAQAYVATAHAAALLLWCAHHYTAHEEALQEFLAIDERGRLAEDRLVGDAHA